MISPPEGIEPSTYGLEVHRAIRCAMGAVIIKNQIDLTLTVINIR